MSLQARAMNEVVPALACLPVPGMVQMQVHGILGPFPDKATNAGGYMPWSSCVSYCGDFCAAPLRPEL